MDKMQNLAHFARKQMLCNPVVVLLRTGGAPGISFVQRMAFIAEHRTTHPGATKWEIVGEDVRASPHAKLP